MALTHPQPHLGDVHGFVLIMALVGELVRRRMRVAPDDQLRRFRCASARLAEEAHDVLVREAARVTHRQDRVADAQPRLVEDRIGLERLDHCAERAVGQVD